MLFFERLLMHHTPLHPLLDAFIIPADGGETGGDGGAIYTGLNSTTLFKRRVVMRFNVGASGGALYNLGTTILETAGYIRGNDALVRYETSTVICGRYRKH